MCLSTFSPSISPNIWPYVCQSICPSVYPTFSTFAVLSILPFGCPYLCLTSCPSVCLSNYYETCFNMLNPIENISYNISYHNISWHSGVVQRHCWRSSQGWQFVLTYILPYWVRFTNKSTRFPDRQYFTLGPGPREFCTSNCPSGCQSPCQSFGPGGCLSVRVRPIWLYRYRDRLSCLD